MKARALEMVVAVSDLTPISAGLGILPAAVASIGDLVGAGPRPTATRLSFTAGDSCQANGYSTQILHADKLIDSRRRYYGSLIHAP